MRTVTLIEISETPVATVPIPDESVVELRRAWESAEERKRAALLAWAEAYEEERPGEGDFAKDASPREARFMLALREAMRGAERAYERYSAGMRSISA